MPRQAPLKIGIYLDFGFGLWRDLAYGINRFALECGKWMLVPLDARSGIPSPAVLRQLDGLIGFLRAAFIESNPPENLTGRLVGISYWDRELPIPRVVNDVDLTGRWGAEYFLQRGYQNFHFVADEAFPNNWASAGLGAAFKKRLREDGFSCEDLRLADLDAGRAQMEFPAAVFGYTDIVARQLVNQLKLVDISVPEEVAVLGVGNDLLERELSSTPLSSIEVDAHRMGHEAALLLNSLLSGDPEAPGPRHLSKIPPLGIVTRASSDSLASKDPVMRRALKLIRREVTHLRSVEQCAKLVGVSRRSLETRFRRELNRTVYAVIQEVRVEYTKRLLLETNMKLTRIAEAAGYGDDRMLSVVFKRHTGTTPSAYRKGRNKSGR